MPEVSHRPLAHSPEEKPMATTDELLDVSMKDYKKPEDLIGENGLLKQLTKRPAAHHEGEVTW